MTGDILIEHLYTVDNYLTFCVKVKSGLFAGASNFCIPRDKLLSLIEQFSIMQKELAGMSEIMDSDSDAFIKFEMQKFGHLSIYGQVGGSHEDHYMRFKYITDQTVLTNMIHLLKKSL